jgi:hypothetical protein
MVLKREKLGYTSEHDLVAKVEKSWNADPLKNSHFVYLASNLLWHAPPFQHKIDNYELHPQFMSFSYEAFYFTSHWFWRDMCWVAMAALTGHSS